MFFVISDRISEDFSENARDILEMVNAKNISDSKIYLFGYEQGFNLEKEVWSHDVLSSDLWKTWRATKASNSNNTGVLIQVANDQPSGAFSLYGSEGWSLDAQTSQIFEFQIDSLSSNTYQIFAKNTEGEKFILYDGNKTGTILCNAFSESSGAVLNELHVYIRGNGTLLELNHIIFYSFK